MRAAHLIVLDANAPCPLLRASESEAGCPMVEAHCRSRFGSEPRDEAPFFAASSLAALLPATAVGRCVGSTDETCGGGHRSACRGACRGTGELAGRTLTIRCRIHRGGACTALGH